MVLMKSNNNLQIETAQVMVCFQKEQLIPLIRMSHEKSQVLLHFCTKTNRINPERQNKGG